MAATADGANIESIPSNINAGVDDTTTGDDDDDDDDDDGDDTVEDVMANYWY
jgi:hypothetical protein